MNSTSALIRTRFRAAAVAGGLAAALALTGCSSSDDDGGGDAAGDATRTPSASASESESAGGSGEGGGLEGSWVTTKGGKAVALVVTGKKAGFMDSGGSTCSGTAGEEMGMQMIHLTCTDGNKDRADGMVKSVDATTLRVSWEGFGSETYTKAEGGQLPSGLPTEGLPST